MTCRERHGLTEKAIESAIRNTRMPVRLIYADVCSPQWLRAKLAMRAKEWSLEIIRYEEPLWPTQVRRRVAERIDTPYAVFIDNDVLVSPSWLEHMVECAEQTGAGIVGPVYLWGANEAADRIHMAGGDLTEEREPDGIVLKERHRHIGAKVNEVELRRSECGFVEFHCMLMRRDVYRAPEMFNERIVCVHEHIHASFIARAMGYKTYVEPAARVTYLAGAPYSLSDFGVFRQRWSHDACESSIQAFAARWGIIDDARSFGVRNYVARHRSEVDPVRWSLQDSRISQAPMQEDDLKQTLTGLIELARSKGYTKSDIEQIAKAYWTALVLSNAGYRPCGRPFINHLVGTASVLVHYAFETRLVQAALLHAAYTHAPKMRCGPKETVQIIERLLGGSWSPVERIVHGYTVRASRWKQLSGLGDWRDVATMTDIDSAILSMANRMDMHLSGEVGATGRADADDAPVLSHAREICDVVGVTGLALSQHAGPAIARPEFFAKENLHSASFRVEGNNPVPMVNPAFFQAQREPPEAEASVTVSKVERARAGSAA